MNTSACVGSDAQSQWRWSLRMAVLVLLGSAFALVFLIDYVGYPHPIVPALVLRVLLLRQDVAGLALLAAIAVLACVPAGRRTALAAVDAIGAHPWRTAAVVFGTLCTAQHVVALDHALAADEYLTLMQSRIFAEGRLTGDWPPELLPWLMADFYRYRWIMVDAHTGDVASVYWPGFALLLAPFSRLGIAWALNPLLAAVALLLLARLARRVAGNPRAAGWAMLLALASPGFAGLALGYFSMTAHLAANLGYAMLLLRGTPQAAFGAGLIGSLALVLHNPVPHLLFATPWLVWLARKREARACLGRLALGYLPGFAVGLAWALFLWRLHGFIYFAPFPSDGALLHEIGNFLWYWHFRSSHAFGTPDDYSLGGRVGEQVRLWAWSAPALAVLAAIGYWQVRDRTDANLLAASFVVTLAGYLFVRFDQGYGWGARYVHPAWGALPVFAAVALSAARATAASLAPWAARAALLSLALALPLRAWQVRDYVAEHLARRPAYEPGLRQYVFIDYDRTRYTQDLAQNDPFLREPTVLLVSRGRRADYLFMRMRHPQARQVSDQPGRGHVWRLD